MHVLQLKTLAVVLKNLVDASKGGLAGDAGLKYRTLKLDNPKLKARLFCVDCVKDLLLDSSLVGMVATETTLVMSDAPSPSICDVVGLKVLPSVSAAQRQIATQLESPTKKARLDATEKLSEKQKARILMEEKHRLEKERERQFRKETRAKIAADKLVRQTDENWKPTVSAAADKTGTGLLSFRDRHGE